MRFSAALLLAVAILDDVCACAVCTGSGAAGADGLPITHTPEVSTFAFQQAIQEQILTIWCCLSDASLLFEAKMFAKTNRLMIVGGDR
jgi:hypothetical protein